MARREFADDGKGNFATTCFRRGENQLCLDVVWLIEVAVNGVGLHAAVRVAQDAACGEDLVDALLPGVEFSLRDLAVLVGVETGKRVNVTDGKVDGGFDRARLELNRGGAQADIVGRRACLRRNAMRFAR